MGESRWCTGTSFNTSDLGTRYLDKQRRTALFSMVLWTKFGGQGRAVGAVLSARSSHGIKTVEGEVRRYVLQHLTLEYQASGQTKERGIALNDALDAVREARQSDGTLGWLACNCGDGEVGV